MKKALILAFLLIPSLGLAQEHGKDTCYTQESMTNNVKSNGLGSYVYYRLYDIDVDLEDPADIIIYTNGHEYTAAAFVKGCYVAYTIMNEEQVLAFLNSHTKKASEVSPFSKEA